jgi:hypothetical protein
LSSSTVWRTKEIPVVGFWGNEEEENWDELSLWVVVSLTGLGAGIERW